MIVIHTYIHTYILYPDGRRLRAVADQLSEFLGLAGLQSVADWEADSWRHLGDLDPDPDPVTSLDSQSKELHRLLQQKPSTET